MLQLPARILVPCLTACGARPQPSAPVAPPQSATQAPITATEDRAPSSKRALTFEPAAELATTAEHAHVEILFPFADQVLRADRARDFVVRLKVEGHSETLVDVSLDDFVPRRRDTLPASIKLGELVPEDRELAAGEHLLVATAVAEDGRLVRMREPRSRAPFAAVVFWVGERGKPALELEKPFIVYRQPRGTYNGPEAADRVLLDFLVLGGSLGDALGARVVMKGAGLSGETLLREPRAMLVRDLPSGDFAVQLALVGADGKPLAQPAAHAARTITVNRDAPLRGKAP
jgi:hypothetical protein